MMKHRINYWSCSRFANFIRGGKKPLALTLKNWEDWHKEQKEKNSFRYWLAENLLDKIQDFVYWPYDKFLDIKYYIKNRFVSKTHYLKTGLRPGYYYEFDQRILYGLFNELVDFVEIELASLGKINVKFKGRRSAEAGIHHLDWASKLVYGDEWGIKQNLIGKPTHQAKIAKKVLELYNWWKQRDSRPEPEKISGWSDYCKKNKSDKTSKESIMIFKKLEKIEKEYEKEDDKMLMELIKIRKDLWS